MKKFLAIFLVLTLLFSLAACIKNDGPDNGDDSTSGQDTEQTADNGETTTKKSPIKETTTAPPFVDPKLTEPAALFALLNLNDYNHKEAKPNTTPYTGVTFIANRYEIKNAVANNISDKIYAGDAEIILNETTVNGLIAQGWTISSKRDANTAVEAGDSSSTVLHNGNKEAVMVKAINKTSNSMSLGDCTITYVINNKDIEQETWADFKIDGKVNTASATYMDFVKTFGMPKSINAVEYYKGNDYTRCKATLIFEKTVATGTLTLTVSFEDTNGKATISSCCLEFK